MISLIIPCYNEEKNIKIFYETCEKTFKNISIEYIFINDGSKDNTLLEIIDVIKNNPQSQITCLNFSRNFGKEAAMLAGLKESHNEFISIIDADLQQNPKYVLEMYKFLKKNKDYDCVACYQDKRKESKILTTFKNCFYKIINKMSEVPLKTNASDFRLFNKNIKQALINMPEYCRFSKGLFSYVGFNVYYMPYQVEKRMHGKTSWSIIKLFKYAMDGILSFSVIPLKFTTSIGFLSFIIAIIYLIIIIIQKIFIGINPSGYATIVCLILIFSGLQMIFLGILGEYIGKIYTEAKRRPKFIIKDKIKSNNIDMENDNEK